MANNTLKARLIQASKTEAEWKSSNPVLLKGEVAYSSDKKQRKTGDGSSKWTDITYDKSVPTEHTHNYAGSSSAGGVANSANKLATPRKINGIAFDGTKDINNVIYTTKKDYDTLVKTGTYDKSAMYVTTDEIDDMSKFNTDLLDSSTSLAKQGKYLSYSDQNGGKYLSIKNTTDNSTVAHAKLMDGESGEGMDVDADKVKTIDSKGILVDALGETTAQALIDEVAKRVIDLTGRMSTTETGLQSANEAITSLNSNKANKNITPIRCGWAQGSKYAYFQMSKETGDVFLPFLCMPTNDGTWTIGVHSATNRLIFQYDVDGNCYKYYLTPKTEKVL